MYELGRNFEVMDGTAVVRVSPLGFRQLPKFISRVGVASSHIANALKGVEVGAGVPSDKLGGIILQSIAPFVLQNAMDLFIECVEVVDAGADGASAAGAPAALAQSDLLDRIPHWEFPPLIEAWLVESFGEEKKWKPWITALENLIKRTTGQDISITSMLSESSLHPVTA